MGGGESGPPLKPIPLASLTSGWTGLLVLPWYGLDG
jgi:hypothetical protein